MVHSYIYEWLRIEEREIFTSVLMSRWFLPNQRWGGDSELYLFTVRNMVIWSHAAKDLKYMN